MMMMEQGETVDGITHSIQEIDMAIAGLSPQLRRKMYRGQVWEQIDELLDTRNDLKSILGELALDEMERMMTNGD